MCSKMSTMAINKDESRSYLTRNLINNSIYDVIFLDTLPALTPSTQCYYYIGIGLISLVNWYI